MSSRAEEQVLIGLGGNIGDPLASMRAALQALDRHAQCRVANVSSIWRTPPWGVTDQPDFLNACADIRTTLEPRPFLDLCLSIEQDLKRVRDVRWGPRSIDMDILFFGDREISEPGLIVPHPRLVDRAFVLVPLAEIAPVKMHKGKSIAKLAVESDQSGMTVQQGSDWL